MELEKRKRLVRMVVENATIPTQPSQEFVHSYENPTGGGRADLNGLEKLKYRYALQKLLQQYFDPDEMGATVGRLSVEMEDHVADLRDEWTRRRSMSSNEDEQQVSDQFDDRELLSMFERRVESLQSDINQSREFTVWFPWHLRWHNPPSQFQAFDLAFEPAENSDWEDALDEVRPPRRSQLRDSCDEVVSSGHSLWKTTVTATFSGYALDKVREALEVLSARLNHAAYGLEFGNIADRDPSRSQVIYTDARWTAIRPPSVVFWRATPVSEDSESDRVRHGSEAYLDTELPEVPIDYNDLRDRYERFSRDFAYIDDNPMHAALIEYQKGLTAETKENAFYSFWRALEALSETEDFDDGAEIIDTALVALDTVSGGEYDPIINEIAPELWDARNNRSESRGRRRVDQAYEQVAKVLVDAMIQFRSSSSADVEESWQG